MDSDPVVVLIVGVPGAGKTTIARALAERLQRSACIEGDLVQHHFTVNGLVAPNELPAEESQRQLELRWDNCACLARNFYEAGFSVIVEHAASRRSWIDRFVSASGGARVSLIILAPTLSVALERDQHREEKQVAHLFAHMDGELRRELAELGWWLDTSTLTIDESVERVLGEGITAGRISPRPPDCAPANVATDTTQGGVSDWLAYCLAKPGAWRDEPWEGDVVAKVATKIFAFLGSAGDRPSIGLKCGDREAADLLLDRYPGTATKTAYIGNHGWNTFALDGTIADDEIAELIDTSYDLVVAKLPKSRRP